VDFRRRKARVILDSAATRETAKVTPTPAPLPKAA